MQESLKLAARDSSQRRCAAPRAIK